ncbi:Peptidyl-prolyl cis-trans isomerase G [Manis javanica]|nr:Peptidyl-prolyl cis-trans isomerase G [Manis javanica]
MAGDSPLRPLEYAAVKRQHQESARLKEQKIVCQRLIAETAPMKNDPRARSGLTEPAQSTSHKSNSKEIMTFQSHRPKELCPTPAVKSAEEKTLQTCASSLHFRGALALWGLFHSWMYGSVHRVPPEQLLDFFLELHQLYSPVYSSARITSRQAGELAAEPEAWCTEILKSISASHLENLWKEKNMECGLHNKQQHATGKLNCLSPTLQAGFNSSVTAVT